MGFSKVLKAASVAASIAAISATSSFAVTNQFRGTNWADKRDNFVSDVLVLSGMSLNMTYESAYALSDRVMSQFVEKLGINSLRIPINEPTALKAWSSYKGIIDGILAHGRMLIGYWGPSQPSGPKSMDDWWKMWDTVVKEYGSNPDAYFEIFNEPHMYKKDELRNLYAKWLDRYPNVPRDHILLDGTGMAQNVPDIADDSRFDGCLFAVHEYTFWNMSINTEEGWRNSFKYKVGKYADRTVCTEWGGAMGPGDKAGVHYEKMDYNSTPTNYFMAYIRGMSEQLREWQMGSFYWVGLRDGDWYSMVTRSGEGANTKLEIVNQSGVDRMHYAWTDTVEVDPVPQTPFKGEALKIPGKIEAEDFDIPGVGKGNDSYSDKDAKNNGNSEYRKDTGVDLYAKDGDRIIVGYNQTGEWLEYTVDVAATGEYTLFAAVASDGGSAFSLSMDGEAITKTLEVPAAKKGEDEEQNFDDYTKVEAKVNLTEGKHILRLTIEKDWMDIDYIEFTTDGIDPNPICKDADGNIIDCKTEAISANVKFAASSARDFNVFSATGKHLGRVNMMGSSRAAAQSLKAAGYANGVYMVREANGYKTMKVQVK